MPMLFGPADGTHYSKGVRFSISPFYTRKLPIADLDDFSDDSRQAQPLLACRAPIVVHWGRLVVT
jgi:hypothetical protein